MTTIRTASVLLILIGVQSLDASVHVLFEPANINSGLFPNDFLTVADSRQKTGRRVNLPLPDCAAQPDLCRHLRALNELDGFNVHPRVSVRFSGPVNFDSLREGIVLMALQNLTTEEKGLHREGQVIRLNEVIFDPETHTAYAKPDGPLDQHRRYALIVTNRVREPSGEIIWRDPAFENCYQGKLPAGSSPALGEYCAAVLGALQRAWPVLPHYIVGASVFTTMSATAWTERARTAVTTGTQSAARAIIHRNIPFNEVGSFLWLSHRRTVPDEFGEFSLPPLFFQGVGSIAFGSFPSRQFLNEQRLIPPTPTGEAVRLPDTVLDLPFHVFLPRTAQPAGGYPVAIFSHGLGDSRFGGPSAMAAVLANAGIATIAINSVGHGLGPLGKVVVTRRDGTVLEIAAPGRTLDLNGDGAYDSTEGCLIVQPLPIGARDCLRQTALDTSQLVQVIRNGMDLDGDGRTDLNPERIYFAGQSLGGIAGGIFTAIEPHVSTAALNAAGGPVINIARWGRSVRPVLLEVIRRYAPALLNRDSDFDDNYVTRNQPAKINQVPGAIELQNFMEQLEWLQAAGDPLSYAPHYQRSPLAGVPAKKVLLQYALGDRTVPNPTSTGLSRFAGLQQFTWVYRHDVARASLGQLPEDPHPYLANVFSLPGIAVAAAAQSQIAGFFASGGAVVPDPNDAFRGLGLILFEVPEVLTEELNY